MSTTIDSSMDRITTTPWAEQGVKAPQAIIFIKGDGWTTEKVWEIVHALNKGIVAWTLEPSCRMVHLHPVPKGGEVPRQLSLKELESLSQKAFEILMGLKEKLGFVPSKGDYQIDLTIQ